MALRCPVCILTVFTLFCGNIQDSSPRGAHVGTLKHSQNGPLFHRVYAQACSFQCASIKHRYPYLYAQRVLFCTCSGVRTQDSCSMNTHVYTAGLCIYTEVHTHDPFPTCTCRYGTHHRLFTVGARGTYTHSHTHRGRHVDPYSLRMHTDMHTVGPWCTHRGAHTRGLSPSAHGGARSAFQRRRSPAESRHTRTRAQAPPLSQGG